MGAGVGSWALTAAAATSVVTTLLGVRYAIPLVARRSRPRSVARLVPGAASGDRATGVRIGAMVTAALLVVATFALASALLSSDGASVYVADHSRRGSSAPYRLAGLWGGLEGSLLFFTALLGGVAALGARRSSVHATTVASAIVAGFALTSRLAAYPFARLEIPAVDGGGLTPILEHPAMLVHPPLLYLGAALTLVPFARAVAAGLHGPANVAWLTSGRRWLLASWATLTAALSLGANWAYVELGWGGYWAWDPIENTGLLPWLAITLFLHAARRSRPTSDVDGQIDGIDAMRTMEVTSPAADSALPQHLLALSMLPFVLVILGALLTRSGIADSVHAFGEAGAVGRSLGSVLAVVMLLATLAVMRAPTRRHVHAGTQRLVRRLLGAQNVLLTTTIVVVLVGTIAPALASMAGLSPRTTGGEFYARLLAPVAVLLVLLVVVTSLMGLARGSRVGSLALGAHAAHFGIVVLALGVAGSTTASTASAGLDPGDALVVHGHTITLVGSTVRDHARGTGIVATVEVRRGDDLVATLHPELNAYPGRGVVLAETAMHSTPRADVQVALRNATPEGTMLIEVAVRPLVMLIWWGTALLVLGGGALLLRTTRTNPARRRQRRRRTHARVCDPGVAQP